MAEYAGEVELGVKLNPKDIKQSASELESQIGKVFEAAAGKKADKGFMQLQSQMSKTVQKAHQLEQKLADLEKTKIPTEQYTQVSKRLEQMNSQFDKLLVKQDEMAEMGKTSGPAWERLNIQMERLGTLIREDEAELKNLVDTGKAFTLGENSSQYEATSQQLASVNNEMRILIEKSNQYDTTGQEVVKTTNQQTSSFGNLGRTLLDVANKAANLVTSLGKTGGSFILNGLKKLGSAISGIGKSSNSADMSFKKMFWSMMKYGLGIRSLYVLFRKLRSAITEGIKNLAQFNGGANSTNVAMSSLVSSLNYLKNAWGAAFSPILSYVAPALTYLMNLIAMVANRIGMLFSALTGKSSFTQTKRTNTDYAASLAGGGSGGKSAQEKYEEAKKKAEEKYNKQMAAVEKKRADAAAKAEEKQAKAAAKLAKEQEKANGQLQAFDELNNITIDVADDLEDAYEIPEFEDPILEEVNWDDFAAGGAGALADMFEEVPVESWAKELAEKIKGVINDLLEPLKKAWDAMGDYVLTGWKYMTKQMGSLFATVGKDFLKVWKQEATVDIFKNILGIVGDIERVIGNIAKNIEKAWKKNDTGRKILENIRDIFGKIVEHIRNVTTYMIEWSDTLDFSPLLESLEELTKKLSKVADFFGGVFEDIMKHLVLPFIKYLVEDGLPLLNQRISHFIDIVDWDKLRANLDKVWQAAEHLAEAFTEGLINTIGNLADEVGKFVNSDTFTTFIDRLVGFVNSIKGEDIEKLLTGIGTGILKVVEGLMDFINAITGSELFQSLMKMLEDWWNSVGSEDIAGVIAAIATAIIGFKFANFVGQGITGFMNFMNVITGGGLATTLTETAGGFTGLADAIGLAAANLGAFAMAAVDIKTFHDIHDIFKDMSDTAETSLPTSASTENGDYEISNWLLRKTIDIGNLITGQDIDYIVDKMSDFEKLEDLFYNHVQDIAIALEDMGLQSGEVKNQIDELYSLWLLDDGEFRESLSGVTDEQIKAWVASEQELERFFDDFSQQSDEYKKNWIEMQNATTDYTESLPGSAEATKAAEEFTGTYQQKVSEGVGSAVAEAENNGLDVGAGLLLGVSIAMTDFNAEDTFGSILESFKQLYDIHSPSGVMEEQGQFLIEGLQLGIEENWEPMMASLQDNMTNIQQFFEESWDAIVTSTSDKFAMLGQAIADTANNIQLVIQDMVINVGNLFNDLGSNIETFMNDLSDTTSSAVSRLGTTTGNVHIASMNIPHLAQGAVIPPNSRFLAMLGDQRSGVNVEAPLETIKQAVAETMMQFGAGSSSNEGDIVINIDGREVFRAVRTQDDIYRKSNGQSAFAY